MSIYDNYDTLLAAAFEAAISSYKEISMRERITHERVWLQRLEQQRCENAVMFAYGIGLGFVLGVVAWLPSFF